MLRQDTMSILRERKRKSCNVRSELYWKI